MSQFLRGVANSAECHQQNLRGARVGSGPWAHDRADAERKVNQIAGWLGSACRAARCLRVF
jgi:hypothetical protein